MPTLLKVLSVLCFLCFPVVGEAQMFVNLGFEEATVPFVPGGSNANTSNRVSVNDGIPGWRALIGNEDVDTVFHNGVSIGGVIISINGPSLPVELGDYELFMVSSQLTPVSILQSGVVPFDAVSLSFYSFNKPELVRLELSGNNVQLVNLGDDRIGGNISEFAGTNVEIKITGLADPEFGVGGHIIDDIRFSSSSIPEPSVVLLLFSFAIAVSFVRRRSRVG